MKEQQRYFCHDLNANQDIKLVKLKLNIGYEGIGIYWTLISLLYSQNGYIDLDYDYLSYELRVDKQIIQKVICDFDLFKIKDNKFFSNRVLLEINGRLSFKKKCSVAGKKGNKKRWKIENFQAQNQENFQAQNIDEKSGTRSLPDRHPIATRSLPDRHPIARIEKNRIELENNISDEILFSNKKNIYIKKENEKNLEKNNEKYFFDEKNQKVLNQQQNYEKKVKEFLNEIIFKWEENKYIGKWDASKLGNKNKIISYLFFEIKNIEDKENDFINIVKSIENYLNNKKQDQYFVNFEKFICQEIWRSYVTS